MARSPSSNYSGNVSGAAYASDIGCGGRLRKYSGAKAWLLVQFDLALPHHFQRRGEAGCENGGFLRGIDDVVDEVFVEPAPVLGHPDQTLERRAGLGQRPHRAFCQMHIGQHALLALRRIGGQQIEQRGGEPGMA